MVECLVVRDRLYAQRLAVLEDRFRKAEDYALTQRVAPPGSYLCIRLDGVKASKIHLKSVLTNQDYTLALGKSIAAVYYLYRDQCSGAPRNFFLCACSISDEVSFVLSDQPNYYDNRLMKLATHMSGALSAAMSTTFQPKQRRQNGPTLSTFDARPIILANATDVADYLSLRWLVSYRNAMGKALRLARAIPDTELYESNLKSDLAGLAEHVAAHGLIRDVEQIMSTFTLWLPDVDRRLQPRRPDTDGDFVWTHVVNM